MTNNSLFQDNTSTVDSDRILYTASSFARANLLNIQEVGTLTATRPHASRRNGMDSFLFFVVIDGRGSLEYRSEKYDLEKGDCVFVDCSLPYVHSTGDKIVKTSTECDETSANDHNDQLWTIKWVHFTSGNMSGIYDKFLLRGGEPVFHPEERRAKMYADLIDGIFDIASADSSVRDMDINVRLSQLLLGIMEDGGDPEKSESDAVKAAVANVKNYIDEHYTEKLTLDGMADMFFVNKFYLERLFKNRYGISVIEYAIHKRITKAKELLRFSDMSVEEVGVACGFGDANYLSRKFKQTEGISPNQYRKLW